MATAILLFLSTFALLSVAQRLIRGERATVRGGGVMFSRVVNLRAVSRIIFAIPLYMMYAASGLLDTRLGLILAMVNLPLRLMLLVNALAEIPLELEEAA